MATNKKDKPKAKPKKKQTKKPPSFITPVGFAKTKRVRF